LRAHAAHTRFGALAGHLSQFTVTADRSGGKSLGVNLLKGPGGKGATIKSVDAQGQLAAKVMPGLKITHINGTDITAMTMRNIGGLIKSSDQCTLTLEGTEPQAAAAAPEAAAGTGEGIYEQPVTEGQPAPVPGDAEPAAAAADEQTYEQPTAGGAQATAGEPAEALIVEVCLGALSPMAFPPRCMCVSVHVAVAAA